jgi:hypothetical protein
MTLSRFNTHVKLSWPGGQSVVLPVTNLTLTPEPFVGTGQPVVTLLGGRRRMEPLSWGYRAALSWDELGPAQALLRTAIANFQAYGPATLALNSDTSGTFSATAVLNTVIPELSAGDLTAFFDRRALKRPGSLTLLTESQQLPLYSWLTD